MRRWWLILVVAVAAAVFWGAACTTHIIWDGSFDLTVYIESRDRPIRAVSCESFGHREDAAYMVEHRLPPERQVWSVVADPYDGRPVQVRVAVSGRESLLGIELSRSHFRYLAVIVTFQDGQQVGRVVEIPDSRHEREVRVVFP